MNLTFVFFCFRMSTILVAFYPKAHSEREKKMCVCGGVGVGVCVCKKQAPLFLLGPWAILSRQELFSFCSDLIL